MPRRDAEEWFVQVGREMASLAEELSAGRPRVASAQSWEPRVDVFEEPARLLIRGEIAGVSSEELSLHYVPERHAIVVRGVRPGLASGESRRAAHLLEIPLGEFSREIALPDVLVDPREIRAQYRNGMLLVVIPKLDHAIVVRTTYVKES